MSKKLDLLLLFSPTSPGRTVPSELETANEPVLDCRLMPSCEPTRESPLPLSVNISSVLSPRSMSPSRGGCPSVGDEPPPIIGTGFLFVLLPNPVLCLLVLMLRPIPAPFPSVVEATLAFLCSPVAEV